jgi:hypothetical protein
VLPEMLPGSSARSPSQVLADYGVTLGLPGVRNARMTHSREWRRTARVAVRRAPMRL